MSNLAENENCELLLSSEQSLLEAYSRNALKLAICYSFEGAQHDGHWCGELK